MKSEGMPESETATRFAFTFESSLIGDMSPRLPTPRNVMPFHLVGPRPVQK